MENQYITIAGLYQDGNIAAIDPRFSPKARFKS